MYTPTVDAGREVSPDGIVRWLLREAVRANPLYVISAALLAYALQQLMIEIDPQIGKLGGVIASQMMLHAYEFAVLLVATVVLKQRTRAGLDMHGLLIVGALYMGVTFIALDELVAIRPHMGMIVASIGLAAVAVNLPGMHACLACTCRFNTVWLYWSFSGLTNYRRFSIRVSCPQRSHPCRSRIGMVRGMDFVAFDCVAGLF